MGAGCVMGYVLLPSIWIGFIKLPNTLKVGFSGLSLHHLIHHERFGPFNIAKGIHLPYKFCHLILILEKKFYKEMKPTKKVKIAIYLYIDIPLDSR